MSKSSILLDKIHLTVRVPRDLPEAEINDIKQVLDDAAFQAALRRAVREVLKQFKALAKVRVVVAR